jgi:hypothetical protein
MALSAWSLLDVMVISPLGLPRPERRGRIEILD